MAKYIYPAVFTKETEGYSVRFDDLESCYTCGETLEEAMEMAEDVLALTLYKYEAEKKRIPQASDLKQTHMKEDEFVNYIKCDTMEYRKMYASKAIKKTLTIPEWLNEEAERAGVNYSKVLQEALISTLGITKQ